MNADKTIEMQSKEQRPEDDTSAATKMDVAKAKKCHFKGCTKTSLQCIIKNHACPEHEEELKRRSREKRKANFQNHSALKKNILIFLCQRM